MKKLVLGALLLLSTLSFGQDSIVKLFIGTKGIPTLLVDNTTQHNFLVSDKLDKIHYYDLTVKVKTSNSMVNSGSYYQPTLTIEQKNGNVWESIDSRKIESTNTATFTLVNKISKSDSLRFTYTASDFVKKTNSREVILISEITLTKTSNEIPTEVEPVQDSVTNFKIVPNPVVNEIIFPNKTEFFYMVTNSSGIRVLVGFGNKVDVSGLSNGIYFLVLKTYDNQKPIKFVK
jgi:hypothetical protein